jgi:2-phospho-L-lactate guanylyltransferase (CobY/MobA/RfbA family)
MSTYREFWSETGELAERLPQLETGTNAIMLLPDARARLAASFGSRGVCRHTTQAPERGYAVSVARVRGVVSHLDTSADLACLPGELPIAMGFLC